MRLAALWPLWLLWSLGLGGTALGEAPAAVTPPTAGKEVGGSGPAKGATSKRTELKPISWVLADLRQEAINGLHKKSAWPRSELNYAVERGVQVDNAEVVRVLQRRLNQDPALDGYVRWQLLSFRPDFELAGAEEADYRRLIAVMPRLIAAPEPELRKPPTTGTGSTGLVSSQSLVLVDRVPVPGVNSRFGGKPVLAVATNGMTLSNGGGREEALSPEAARLMVADAADRLALARGRIGYANLPALAFRDAVVDLLPRRGAVRFAAAMEDAWGRLSAGDLSAPWAMDRLVDESFELHARGVGQAFYKDALPQLEQMRTHGRDVTLWIELSPAGAKARRVGVEPTRAQMDLILENVRLAQQGHPPRAQRPVFPPVERSGGE